MKARWIALVVVFWLVIAGAAGFGGYSLGVRAGQNQAQAVRNRFLQERGLAGNGQFGAGQTGQNVPGAPGGMRGFNADSFAVGEVKSVDGNTIQLSTAREVLTVKIGDQTQVQKMAEGSAGDIQPGERIVVQGTRGSDGAFSAQMVQIGGRLGPGNMSPVGGTAPGGN